MSDARSPLLPLKGLHEQIESVHAKQSGIRTPSEKVKALKAVVIWERFFKGCQICGNELLRDGAIGTLDLEAWQNSKNKIVELGIPAYTFIRCFLHSIKSSSAGFLMGDVELTNINRPEGRIFDWLFEPMSLMKEQLKRLHLNEYEELYLYKLALYCGDIRRIEAWDNGGVPPYNDIRRAQLEGISRRLHGFCLTITRLPTFRRLFCKVINALLEEEKQKITGYGSGSLVEVMA